MRNSKQSILLVGLFSILFILSGCLQPTTEPANPTPTIMQTEAPIPTEIIMETPTSEQLQNIIGNLSAHFIDVGQGDSCFVSLPNGQNILIDAGDNGYGEKVVSYIKSLGVSKIDHIMCTHPHSDHIGGMDTVIDNFDITNIFMPDITATTQTFESVLTAIESKDLSITVAEAGTILFDYDNLKAKFIAPVTKTDDANNMSLVLYLSYGETSFLFTGDAEDESERQMLDSGFNLKSDVLKVGHHGSKTSSTPEFIKAVAPKYGIISVGKNNQYDHPHADTLATLNNIAALIYRTDDVGTIIVTSDGVNITIDKNATEIIPNAPPITEEPAVQDTEVFITNTGKRYHLGSCSSLSKSKIPISLENAKKQGYTDCGRCHPPK